MPTCLGATERLLLMGIRLSDDRCLGLPLPTGWLGAEPALFHRYWNGATLTESLLSWTDIFAALRQSLAERRSNCSASSADRSWSHSSEIDERRKQAVTPSVDWLTDSRLGGLGEGQSRSAGSPP